LKLRAAIDADGVAGDPARGVESEECHHQADVGGLADALERLHARTKVSPTSVLPSSVLAKFDMSVSITPGAMPSTRRPRALSAATKYLLTVRR
jgi:hypothetical protein